MADITKCGDAKCPSREQCRRWTVKSDDLWQSYADFNREEGKDKCEEGFWPDWTIRGKRKATQ